MLALWHLAGGLPLAQYPQEAQELLSASGYPVKGLKVPRVALVGNHFAPQGESHGDIRAIRIWTCGSSSTARR